MQKYFNSLPEHCGIVAFGKNILLVSEQYDIAVFRKEFSPIVTRASVADPYP